MRPAEVNGAGGRLNDGMRKLKLRWEDVIRTWRDPVRFEFQEQRFEPLEPRVRQTVDAINRLGTVLVQAYEECS